MNPTPCRRCKCSDQIDLVEFLPGGFLVKACCGACGFEGPLVETEDAAKAAWNDPYEFFVRESIKILDLGAQGKEAEADAIFDRVDEVWYSLSTEEKDRFSRNAEEEMKKYR
jgi:hypothetical protein